MPVIIAEYGDSTNGSTPDAGGMQNVQAVINSGVGSAAWSWVSGGSDALRNGDGSLSGYGQTVAAFTSGSGTQGCAESPIAVPDPTQNTQIKAAADPALTGPAAPTDPTAPAGTIKPGQGSVVDSQGNAWTISASGSIRIGDTWVPGGGGTSELIIVNGVVYGKDDGHGPVNAGGWFTLSTDGQYWTPSAPPHGATVTTAGAVQPVTAPPLTPASTVQTAPTLTPASTDQTAPPLAPNGMSVADVAAMAAGQ